MEEERFKQSQAMMAKVLDHESMLKGKFAPNKGFIETESGSNNWEIEYGEEEEFSKEANGSTKCTRRSYLPRPRTLLFEYLDDIRNQIIKDDSIKSQKYIHPKTVSSPTKPLGRSPVPDEFYKDVVVRIWIPDHQFNGIRDS